VLADPYRNITACETVIPTFRCPSMGLPEHVPDQTHTQNYVRARVPSSYIGCASGMSTSQQVTQVFKGEFHFWLEQLDGVLFAVKVKEPNTKFGTGLVSIAKITDGTSKTVLVGEAVSDLARLANVGANGFLRREPNSGKRKDHWYIGGDSFATANPGDPSEALGSTGVDPNMHKIAEAFLDCESLAAASQTGADTPKFHTVGPYDCDGLQLSFSSEHPGMLQVVMCDGSVQTIQEDIDLVLWQDMGTRSDKFLFFQDF
jgi:hypothetical protein